ncbi:TonB-dependent receptor [Stenotrophomonas terrae]|uniref:TonB-dependent receptor n=2 Tax=Stenotrophomonas terrae TaxID=405446 RepID=A0A0R0CL98_9GAMM|nr:TonB-dependent receptor [Stenotrophomonas terrae]
MLIPAAAMAQDDAGSAKTLDKVTVTGSLIPQTQIETATPVTVISADDIRARGFSSVTEVLQKSSMATGAVQGAQTSASFTQGAETISLFGLPPGYVKYLIDGRPMSSYPALYNGSDTFNNISGIPVDLVERIEILPGGQSSLYGSDAIAGVINVILKKSMDGAAFSFRGGGYSEGGGGSVRASFADGWTSADGRVNVLGGIQYEERDPIWGYQRDLTKQFNPNGYSPALASRDFLIFSPFTSYKFLDPANCDNVKGLFGGTMDLQNRPGFGDGKYCGSFDTAGYRTIMNEKKSTQVYVHGTFDVNDNVQLYGDALYSHEQVKYHAGSGYMWWGTNRSFGGYFYDPNLDDLLNLQRAFAPEEMGGKNGFNNTMSRDTSKSLRVTFGAKGIFGASNWDYDIGGTYTEYKLSENSYVRFADAAEKFFVDRVLGPQQGLDPYYGNYGVFTPDYAAFYTPITPEEFASFTGRAVTHSKTSDSMIRAQVTNGTLFTLPGGDAGLAVVAEFGKQKWDYAPDAGYLDGSIWGQTSVAGGGKRDRYAVTSELRLPVLEPLTLSLSGRYDAFKASGRNIDKPTYAVALEYRPIDSLLIRGKYGTAFRAPTLSDLYQGESGFYSTVVDYYNCSKLGFSPDDTQGCPALYSSRQYFGTQAGSIDLKPINADVWSAGVVWSPIDRMALTVDYFNWDISDEVTQQSARGLSLQDYRCRTGVDDINSPLCVATMEQVTRNAVGMITEIYTPKINVSNQQLEALNASFNYGYDFGNWGDLSVRASYTEKLRHKYQQYAEDGYVDLLNDPYWSSDPKRKADASLTWLKGNFSATWYTNWFGSTPNYAATFTDKGYAGNRAAKFGSYSRHNASISYRILDGLDVSLMVNNVFNKMPPYDFSYPGTETDPYNSSNFDVYGRAYYVEMRYAFGK